MEYNRVEGASRIILFYAVNNTVGPDYIEGTVRVVVRESAGNRILGHVPVEDGMTTVPLGGSDSGTRGSRAATGQSRVLDVYAMIPVLAPAAAVVVVVVLAIFYIIRWR